MIAQVSPQDLHEEDADQRDSELAASVALPVLTQHRGLSLRSSLVIALEGQAPPRFEPTRGTKPVMA